MIKLIYKNMFNRKYFLILSSVIPLFFVSGIYNVDNIYGYKDNYKIEIIDHEILIDQNEIMNVIGSVKNNEYFPVKVVIGLDIEDKYGDKALLKSSTFADIIYPDSAVPFKINIDTDEKVLGKPYIIEVDELKIPWIQSLSQNYANIPIGKEKALVGTVKNTGSVVVEDVQVYASVHAEDGKQIDSVKSKVIPIIKPGEEVLYQIIPDPTIKPDVSYFSCAGLNINNPINTLKVDDDEYVAFKMESVSKISNFKYEKKFDGITLDIKPYNPAGGDFIFQVPQMSEDHKVNVKLDGQSYNNTSITGNGKTLTIKVFVPPEDHNLIISGITNKFV
ncbi:MAG: FxLYD domain-containing protein [Nitrososphaeraceae archaeon]